MTVCVLIMQSVHDYPDQNNNIAGCFYQSETKKISLNWNMKQGLMLQMAYSQSNEIKYMLKGGNCLIDEIVQYRKSVQVKIGLYSLINRELFYPAWMDRKLQIEEC